MLLMLSRSDGNMNIQADAEMPTKFGNFRIRAFRDPDTNKEHVLLYTGMELDSIPLIRVHSECLTGDAFGSLRCDCGAQLEAAMEAIQLRGKGAIVYMRQEGRGIGLYAKMQAYALQDEGMDTLDANLALGLPADGRTYEFAAKMLKSVGFTKVNIMTNNPEKKKQLTQNGIEIAARVPIIVGTCEYNIDYLQTKANRMGHMLRV
tara:strand:+ start:358 stop:972 length:615 start_codon:yes stop_codon:yes gene_type:complete